MSVEILSGANDLVRVLRSPADRYGPERFMIIDYTGPCPGCGKWPSGVGATVDEARRSLGCIAPCPCDQGWGVGEGAL